tara:strand:+ start:4701 stop:6710 length:2010 start_codon:yes stop_codon:yes gene_type:complete
MAGGLTKGKSHAKGGIKMEVKSTGQNIEVEGGEGIINKHTMSSKDKHTYEGKEMTACEIASDLNQKTGNGVSFDCDETDNTDMTPTDPSTGFAKGGKPKRKYKKKKMAKSKKKTGAYAKLVSKIMKRDGVTYREAQKKAKDEYVSGATSQKKKPKKTYKGRVDNLKSKSATKISYSGRPKKAQGGELMDADTQVDYAKGGKTTGGGLKEEDNSESNLRKELKSGKITQNQFSFRSKARELNVPTYSHLFEMKKPFAKGGKIDYNLVTKFTDIEYDKRTATIKRLFVGITNDNELYFLDIGDRGAKDFSITGDEVYGITEDDAINQTREIMLDYLLEGEGDLNYISSDYYDIGNHFENILEESMESYVNDIAYDEERFKEECVDAGIVSQSQADNEDFEDMEDEYREQLVEYLVGLEDAEDWFKSNFGEKDYNLQIVNNNLIDFEAYLDDQDLIHNFDNSTLPEYIEVDGVDYVFGASGGGQNRDTLDNLKVSFLPTKILNLIRVNWDDYHLSTLPESMFFPEIEQDEDEILEYYIKNLDRYAKGGQTKKFNNGGNIMDKKLELAASLSSQLEAIDFEYLDWDQINSFDELEEAVDNNGFFQQEVIYYATAMNYLREEDNSLTESLGLAADMGYQTENINSELLASILKSERVRESFYELRTEIDDFFDE